MFKLTAGTVMWIGERLVGCQAIRSQSWNYCNIFMTSRLDDNILSLYQSFFFKLLNFMQLYAENLLAINVPFFKKMQPPGPTLETTWYAYYALICKWPYIYSFFYVCSFSCLGRLVMQQSRDDMVEVSDPLSAASVDSLEENQGSFSSSTSTSYR